MLFAIIGDMLFFKKIKLEQMKKKKKKGYRHKLDKTTHP